MIFPALYILLFGLTALAYAMVGFGGGSTYNALLVLADTDYRLIPSITLTCNILVVSGGVWHFWREGHFKLREILPFIVLSMPMAWVGGRMHVSEQTFVGLLGIALLATAVQMLIPSPQHRGDYRNALVNPWLLGLPFGAGIGFLSGVVGIGGGIFLAPLLSLVHWAPPKRIAVTASAFIWFNSVAGLSGQLMKQAQDWSADRWMTAWPLFVAVIIGGQLGSHLGARHLPGAWVRGLTAALVLYVALRLLLKWYRIGFA